MHDSDEPEHGNTLYLDDSERHDGARNLAASGLEGRDGGVGQFDGSCSDCGKSQG